MFSKNQVKCYQSLEELFYHSFNTILGLFEDRDRNMRLPFLKIQTSTAHFKLFCYVKVANDLKILSEHSDDYGLRISVKDLTG